MDKITYEESLAHFQAQGPMWDALCASIKQRRDMKFRDLKRNMETPNCNQKADDKILGAMVECDDILYEFETAVEVED